MLVFKEAGRLGLFRYRDSKRFLSMGAVQSLIPTMNNQEAELEDGNSDWPLTFSAGKTGNLTVNLNTFVPHIYSALVSMEQESGTFDEFEKIDKHTIPSTSPYSISLSKTPVTDTLVVHDLADSPFTMSTTPTQGQYKLNEESIEFSSADAGRVVITAFNYQSTGIKAGLPEKTNNDVFRAIVAGEAVLEDNEGVAVPDTLIFDRVMPTGEIARPPRQKTPTGWSFTLKILPPRPGHRVVEYLYEQA